MIWRFRLILIVFLIFFSAVVLRLFYWQVVRASDLVELGQSQYGRFIKVIPKRGEITTSDGFPIVSNKINYLVFANPKEVKEKKKTVELLAPILELEKASISASLDKNLFWVPIKPDVAAEVKSQIEKLNLKGIGFEKQYSRFYPEASMGATLTGFVGKNELGGDKGYYGLEGFYDRQLRGKASYAVSIYDALGKPILARQSASAGGVDGRNLITSIVRPIQFVLEKSLRKGMERYGAQGAMAVVMNPKTGEIIAMASFPSFDQSHYEEYSEEVYKNPIISNFYEPGSTFKSLIMSAALDAGVVKPDTKCPICDGPISIGGYTIKTWNDKYNKNTTMVDVIKNSDNTGMVFVGNKLGLSKMISYLENFGIGKLTGMDLQGEVASALRLSNEWYPIDLATASFGQGISVTPIELLTTFSAIANEGRRMEPHVVSKIEEEGGREFIISPKVVSRPVSPKTAKVMTEILVNAVNKGEAKWTRLKGYRIAGKTGTSQIPIAGHYDPNKTIASFIGFAPADDPKFSMLVIIDKPTTSIYGSETAAPIFFEIAKHILDYYKIPPTE